MTDGALSWLAMVAAAYLCDGRVPGRGDGQLDGRLPLLLPLRGVGRLGHLRGAGAEVLARLLRGRRARGPDRGAVRAARLRRLAEVADVFRSRTRDEWRAFNDEHDRCIEPVLDLDEALDSELVREREMVVELEQPSSGPVRLLGLPIKLSRTPGDATRPAPALGEHTEEVLREAGFDGDGDRRAPRKRGGRRAAASRSRRRGSWDERAAPRSS